MDGGRQDVELLAPVGAVAVAEQAELLEHVERAIDGRGDRARGRSPGSARRARTPVTWPSVFDEDLDERPALWRPAQAAGAQPVAHVRPNRRRAG